MSISDPVMTSTDSTEPQAEQRFRPIALPDIGMNVDGTIDWLWNGFVARRNVTLLISLWKAGKTTLLTVLLARWATGGSLAGLAVRPARVVVLSEEDASLWAGRQKELNIGGHAAVLCRPFRGRPRAPDWQALVEFLAGEVRFGRLDLVVVDSLSKFLPGSENDPASIQAFVGSLQSLTDLGAAVLILHHPKKGAVSFGQASRGSGALPAAVDIIVEMGWLGLPDDQDRRRLLCSMSRHGTTPRRLAIEWTADGRDYVALGESATDDFEACWPVLQALLEDAHQKHTRKGILKAWPQDHPRPSDMTLWRWLDRALAEGRVLRDGLGRSRKPYRFWLPGQEERLVARPVLSRRFARVRRRPGAACCRQCASPQRPHRRRARGEARAEEETKARIRGLILYYHRRSGSKALSCHTIGFGFEPLGRR